MTSLHVARFKSPNPRKNLPAASSRKRGESNFLRAFERAYVEGHCRTRKVSWQDFAVAGYGIADLVMVGWKTSRGASAFTVEQLRSRLRRQRLTAFELKLNSCRKALMQAHRYRYFCDRSIVVLPAKLVAAASAHLDLFRSLNVGLWEFDVETGRISKKFTPRASRAFNAQAREKAISAILARVQLCKTLKQVKSRR